MQPTTDVNNKANTAIQELTAKMNDLELTGAANNIVEPLRRDSGVESPDAQDEATTISLVDDTIKPRKNRSDSGCSYGTSDEAVAGGKASSSGTSADSGNGSTEADDGMVYSYHFIIQSHLCGTFSKMLFNFLSHYGLDYFFRRHSYRLERFHC